MRVAYIYSWGARMRGVDPAHDAKWGARKGQTVELVARGTMNSAVVQFAGGALEVISRSALRRLPKCA